MRYLFLLLALVATVSHAVPPRGALAYRSILVREAHLAVGLEAPIPLYAAQIEQESSWRPGITAWDNGRGLAQFMDPTTDFITKLYPELGKGDPYNPTWAIRALIRYDQWLVARVKGLDECQKRGAALKAYNAGLGYVLQQQKKSSDPRIWFGLTEDVPTKQSAENQKHSRMYPRWILFKRQPNYKGWGTYTCETLVVE